MQQSIRVAYLKEMGIEPWYPAMKLVNSPPPLMMIEGAPSAPVDSVMSEITQDIVQPVRLALETGSSGVVLNTERIPQLSSVTPSTERPNTVRAVNSKPIKFALGLYAVGHSLVVSTLVPSHEVQQHHALSLIQSILRTFCDEDPTPAYHHVISWPFFQNVQADQGKAAAKDYVESVATQLMDKHRLTRLVSFGGVLPTLNGWVTESGLVVPDNTLALPSVYKMLSDANEKAKAWQIIKRSNFYATQS